MRTDQLSTYVDQDGISIPAMAAAIGVRPSGHGMSKKEGGTERKKERH